MSTLFAATLDKLHPDRLRRIETEDSRGVFAEGELEVPTNGDILDAAKQTYQKHSTAVDASAHSGIAYVKSPSGRPNVATLNAYDWKTQKTEPITPTAFAVYESPIIRPGVTASHDDQDILTLVYGISESAQLIIGEEGGVGIAFGSDGTTLGTGYIAGKLVLDRI